MSQLGLAWLGSAQLRIFQLELITTIQVHHQDWKALKSTGLLAYTLGPSSALLSSARLRKFQLELITTIQVHHQDWKAPKSTGLMAYTLGLVVHLNDYYVSMPTSHFCSLCPSDILSHAILKLFLLLCQKSNWKKIFI